MRVLSPEPMIEAIIKELEMKVTSQMEMGLNVREFAANLASLCLWKRQQEMDVMHTGNGNIPDLGAGMIQGMKFLPEYIQGLLERFAEKETDQYGEDE